MAPLTVDSVADEAVELFGAAITAKTCASPGSYGAKVILALAKANPQKIVLACRSFDSTQAVIDELREVAPSVAVSFVHLDLQEMASVRQAARDIQSTCDTIHGLINCAGIMAPEEFATSPDGIERQFATNHVGHFLLTNLLMQQLKNGKGRVCNVTSRAHIIGPPDFDDVNFDNGEKYNGWVAYAASKTANILFTVALAKRCAASGVSTIAVDPGTSLDTKLFHNSGISPAGEYFASAWEIAVQRNNGAPLEHAALVTADQAAATIVHATVDPSLSGSYTAGCQVSQPAAFASNPDDAEKLWKLTEALVGEEFGW